MERAIVHNVNPNVNVNTLFYIKLANDFFSGESFSVSALCLEKFLKGLGLKYKIHLRSVLLLNFYAHFGLSWPFVWLPFLKFVWQPCRHASNCFGEVHLDRRERNQSLGKGYHFKLFSRGPSVKSKIRSSELSQLIFVGFQPY